VADLISFPFRLSQTGSIVVHPEDSPEYYAELLAVLIGTVPGERTQVPLFGVSDPTFNQIDAHELTSKVNIFGPPVTIATVSTAQVSETEQDVLIEFGVRTN
jgi:hypothetical protein